MSESVCVSLIFIFCCTGVFCYVRLSSKLNDSCVVVVVVMLWQFCPVGHMQQDVPFTE